MKKTWLLSLLLVCCATPSWAAIAYVNSVSGVDGWGGDSATTQTTSSWSLSSGNFVAVCVRWGDNAVPNTTATVTDTAGNTYTDGGSGRLTQSSDSGFLQLFYAYNVTGHASNVVTATFSSSQDYKAVVAAEYSGVKTSASPVDTGNTGTAGATNSVTSGAFTPSAANEIAVACAGLNVGGFDGSMVAGSSYTVRKAVTVSTHDKLAIEDRIGAPVSSQTASMSKATGSLYWGIIVRAFAEATASRRPFGVMVMP